MTRAPLLVVAALLATATTPALAQSAASSSSSSSSVPAAPTAPAAPAAAPSTAMNVYGPGTASCATYLNDRSLRINADGWILGMWTGMNRSNPDTKLVGSTTDSRGIVGEVARACRDQPSVTLFQTEKEVYDRFKAAGR